MHYHLEIVMPPTDDVKAAVEQILAPFDESPEHPDEDGPSGKEFFDYWDLGGRWSGSKLQAAFPKERLDAFWADINAAKFTVSGLIAGKEEINPSSQIPAVDALWCKHFPESPVKVCPMFKHYKGDIGDVMRLGDVPQALTCSRVIVAHHWKDAGKLEAGYMVETEFWNGVCHTRSFWGGKFLEAMADHAEKMMGYREEYRAKNTPTPDWLVVTIDYHS